MLIFYPWVSSWWGLSNPDGSLVVVLEGSWCYNVNGRIFPRHIRTWFIRFTKQRFKFINTKITTSLTWCLVLLVLTPGQNVTFFKVVFKIYFKPFWVILVKKNWVKKWGGGQTQCYKCYIFLKASLSPILSATLKDLDVLLDVPQI